MTYYEILGVPRHATQDEIRTAYRELARQYHPDAVQGASGGEREQAEENIKALNAAYDTLSEPAKRRAYHAVMGTRYDPARRYRFRGAGGASQPRGEARPRGNAAPRNPAQPDLSAELQMEILQLRHERIGLAARQAAQRRRLWMSAGFTSLVVFVLMSMRIGVETAMQEGGPIVLYFLGVELVALPIVAVAAGLRQISPQIRYNPVTFAWTVSLGMMIMCLSTFYVQLPIPSYSPAYQGVVISSALGVHLLAVMGLSRWQDESFGGEREELENRIRLLEARLENMREKRRR